MSGRVKPPDHLPGHAIDNHGFRMVTGDTPKLVIIIFFCSSLSLPLVQMFVVRVNIFVFRVRPIQICRIDFCRVVIIDFAKQQTKRENCFNSFSSKIVTLP